METLGGFPTRGYGSPEDTPLECVFGVFSRALSERTSNMLAPRPESSSPPGLPGGGDASRMASSASSSPLNDESLARQAERLLHASSYSQLALVDCHTRGDVLVLSGRVPSYYLKQVAQFVVSQYDPSLSIVNEIEVNRPLRRW